MGMHAVPVEDPLCVPDVFVEGVAKIEKIGDCMRVSLYSEHDGSRRIVARIVWPSIAIATNASRQIAAFYERAAALEQ